MSKKRCELCNDLMNLFKSNQETWSKSIRLYNKFPEHQGLSESIMGLTELIKDELEKIPFLRDKCPHKVKDS